MLPLRYRNKTSPQNKTWKDAGQATKQAAKDTGHATKKAAKTTGHEVKKTTKKATHRTAEKTKEGAQKVEDKTKPNCVIGGDCHRNRKLGKMHPAPSFHGSAQ